MHSSAQLFKTAQNRPGFSQDNLRIGNFRGAFRPQKRGVDPLFGGLAAFSMISEAVKLPKNFKNLYEDLQDGVETARSSHNRWQFWRYGGRVFSAISSNLAGIYAAIFSADDFFKKFDFNIGLKEGMSASAIGIFAVPCFISLVSCWKDIKKFRRLRVLKKLSSQNLKSQEVLKGVLEEANKHSKNSIEEALASINKHYPKSHRKFRKQFYKEQINQKRLNAKRQITEWQKKLQEEKKQVLESNLSAWVQKNKYKSSKEQDTDSWLHTKATILQHYERQEAYLELAKKNLKGSWQFSAKLKFRFEDLKDSRITEIGKGIERAEGFVQNFIQLRGKGQKEAFKKAWSKHVLDPIDLRDYYRFRKKYAEVQEKGSFKEKQEIEREAKKIARRFGFKIENYGKDLLGRKISRKTLSEMILNKEQAKQDPDSVQMSEIRALRFKRYFNDFLVQHKQIVEKTIEERQESGEALEEIQRDIRKKILQHFLELETQDISERIHLVTKKTYLDTKIALFCHFCNFASFALSIADCTQLSANVFGGISFAASLYRLRIKIPEIHDPFI